MPADDTADKLTQSVDKLERTIGRFVVAMERMLASNDAAAETSRKALAGMHPDMAKIQADVRKKLASRKLAR